DVDHRVAGEDTRLEGFADALLDRRDVLPRNGAALDLVLELEARSRRQRLDAQEDVAVLATAARLAAQLVFLRDLLADRLAVGDLRLADVGVDLELAQQAVDDDLEVQLAHAGDDRLAGLLVRAHAEGRILGRELRERGPELLLVSLGLRLDRDVD